MYVPRGEESLSYRSTAYTKARRASLTGQQLTRRRGKPLLQVNSLHEGEKSLSYRSTAYTKARKASPTGQQLTRKHRDGFFNSL
jgi:hypothetical protein